MVSSFFRCVIAAGAKTALAYSIWERIKAVYASNRSCLGRCEAARCNNPNIPFAFLTMSPICCTKVRWRSRVTPSNFTWSDGWMLHPSRLMLIPSCSFLWDYLNKINWVFSVLIMSSRSSQNDFVCWKDDSSLSITLSSDLSASEWVTSSANWMVLDGLFLGRSLA